MKSKGMSKGLPFVIIEIFLFNCFLIYSKPLNLQRQTNIIETEKYVTNETKASKSDVEVNEIDGQKNRLSTESEASQKNANLNNFEVPNESNNIEVEIPSGFKKDYESAVFDRFNSYASENGLGGTKIWIQGKFEKLFEINGDYCCLVDVGEEHKWLVDLDKKSKVPDNTYQNLVSHIVCIRGVYNGWSSIYEYPSMVNNRVFDITSGNLISPFDSTFSNYEYKK